MSRATLLDDIFGVPLIASVCLRFLCMQVRHVPRYMISSVSLGSLAVLLHGSLTRLDDSAAAAAAAAAAIVPSAAAHAIEEVGAPRASGGGEIARPSGETPRSSSPVTAHGTAHGRTREAAVSRAEAVAAVRPGDLLHAEALVDICGGERSLAAPFRATTPSMLLIVDRAHISALRSAGHLAAASAAAQRSVCSRYLRQLLFFRALPAETIAKVAAAVQLRVVAKGEPAVSPHVPQSLVLVARGAVHMPGSSGSSGAGSGSGASSARSEKPRAPLTVTHTSARSWCNEAALVESAKGMLLYNPDDPEAAVAAESARDAARARLFAAPRVPIHLLPVALEPSILLLVPPERFLDLRVAIPTFTATAGNTTLLAMREELVSNATLVQRAPKRNASLVSAAERQQQQRSVAAILRWEILVLKILPDSSFSNRGNFSLNVSDYAEPTNPPRKDTLGTTTRPSPRTASGTQRHPLQQQPPSFRTHAAKEAAAWSSARATAAAGNQMF